MKRIAASGHLKSRRTQAAELRCKEVSHVIFARMVVMALAVLLVAAPAVWSRPHDEVQAPRGQEIQAPRGDEIQAPRGDEIQAPRWDNGHEFPTPRR